MQNYYKWGQAYGKRRGPR